MSIWYSCDRCGSIVDDKSDIKEVMLCYEDDMLEGIGDLCEDCVDGLMKFMHCADEP